MLRLLPFKLAVTVLFGGLIFVSATRTSQAPFYSAPKIDVVEPAPPVVPEVLLSDKVRGFLEQKKSPLAAESEFLVQQKHWRLLVAVSSIESQFCRRQIGYNCWGISNTRAAAVKTGHKYRVYSSLRAAIADADQFIDSWQKRGRWLTVDAMNGSYVVPASPNWAKSVKSTLEELEKIKEAPITPATVPP